MQINLHFINDSCYKMALHHKLELILHATTFVADVFYNVNSKGSGI